MKISLFAAVGNPGAEYRDTLHNAGVWLLERVASTWGVTFREEKKWQARIATAGDLKLLIPTTFMNHSGRAIVPFARYFRIEPEAMLIAHDELDLEVGTVRFKQGGGLAGHNGLRSIASEYGAQSFNRVRIGVGHPGQKDRVTGHLLGRSSQTDREVIERCIAAVEEALPLALAGEWQKAMNQLHNQDFRPGQGDAPAPDA